jgi:hypothetical protein
MLAAGKLSISPGLVTDDNLLKKGILTFGPWERLERVG